MMKIEWGWENEFLIELEVLIANIDCNRKHLSPSMRSLLSKLEEAYKDYSNEVEKINVIRGNFK